MKIFIYSILGFLGLIILIILILKYESFAIWNYDECIKVGHDKNWCVYKYPFGAH